MFSLHADFEPQCASVHPGQTEVAVGGKTVSLLRLSCCYYRGTQRENKKKYLKKYEKKNEISFSSSVDCFRAFKRHICVS